VPFILVSVSKNKLFNGSRRNSLVKVRGSIKEMERELGISYPTVRNRLEQVAEVLGYQAQQVPIEPNRRQQILKQLDQGEITSEEALRLLSDK
jgi:hypothetical protein